MITRDEVLARSEEIGGVIPLLTLEEFFEGNEFEESIAPNQWGEGRPSVAHIAARLRALEADPDVAWVRVQLHEEMFEDEYDGLAAEGIAICTTFSDEEVDEILDPEELHAGPVFEGFVYDDELFGDIPEIPPRARVYSLVWS